MSLKGLTVAFLVNLTWMVLCFWSPYAHAQARVKPLHYGNSYPYPKQATLEMDTSLLGKCFWLEAAKYSKLTLENVSRQYPMLFKYLEGSIEVDYITGNESLLRERILSSADHSVDPVRLFSWSLQLNQGSLFEAVLTIHELLRNEARFYNKWVRYPSDKTSMRIFFNKFIDIRGDLEERGDAFNGDHRGSWYRIWGSMLHLLKMVSPNESFSGTAIQTMRSAEGLSLAAIQGAVTAHLAEWLKPIIMYGGDPDPRKVRVNQWGYQTMVGMFRAVDEEPMSAVKRKFTFEQCRARAYLVAKNDSRVF